MARVLPAGTGGGRHMVKNGKIATAGFDLADGTWYNSRVSRRITTRSKRIVKTDVSCWRSRSMSLS